MRQCKDRCEDLCEWFGPRVDPGPIEDMHINGSWQSGKYARTGGSPGRECRQLSMAERQATSSACASRGMTSVYTGLGIRQGRRRLYATAAQRHAADGLRNGAAAADGSGVQFRFVTAARAIALAAAACKVALAAACAAARTGRGTHGTAEWSAGSGTAVHETRIHSAGLSDSGALHGGHFPKPPEPCRYVTWQTSASSASNPGTGLRIRQLISDATHPCVCQAMMANPAVVDCYVSHAVQHTVVPVRRTDARQGTMRSPNPFATDSGPSFATKPPALARVSGSPGGASVGVSPAHSRTPSSSNGLSAMPSVEVRLLRRDLRMRHGPVLLFDALALCRDDMFLFHPFILCLPHCVLNALQTWHQRRFSLSSHSRRRNGLSAVQSSRVCHAPQKSTWGATLS